jgi:hypothetical protein
MINTVKLFFEENFVRNRNGKFIKILQISRVKWRVRTRITLYTWGSGSRYFL